jgi:hypothetical protein
MATPYKVGATGQSTTAATAKCLVQINAAATRRVLVKEVSIGFASTTSSDGAALVELVRATTAGTATSSTPLLNDPGATAATAGGSINSTVEPTVTDVLRSWNVPVQGGLLVYQMPLGEEVLVAASGRIALRVTTPQNQSSVTSYIAFDEVA